MSTSPRPGDWIQTHSGLAFWPLDPREEEMTIEDVAQGLSHLCRFGGQCVRFYSVAQHSVLVSELAAEMTRETSAERRRLNALAGLLHDAPEAFICDLPRPVKAQIPRFREIEDRIWAVAARKWGLLHPDGSWRYDAEVVRLADDTALITEKRALMQHPVRWDLEDHVAPAVRAIDPIPPEDARTLFLTRFADLSAAP